MKRFFPIFVAAVLCIFSCTKSDVPEVEGEIKYKTAPSASFTAEGGEKTIRFTCTGDWHIDCDAEWLSFSPASARGDGLGTSASYKVIITAAENTEEASRSAEVSIVSGTNHYDFTATQKAPVITLTPEQVMARGIDPNRVYSGVMGSVSKLYSSDAEFYLGRAKVSPNGHFIVFWDKGYDETGEILPGDERTAENIRVDIDDLLKKAEIFYDCYINKLNFAGEPGKSYLDKYYMTICLYGTTNWKAEGGGSGYMGALWVSATACQPTGSTIAHEIGHAFQYQVYSDYGQKDAGFMAYGGQFWEACGNWQSYNLYAEQAFNSANFTVFTENHMRHFIHEHQRYASYWFMFDWVDEHGWESYGRVWKESKASEDPAQAYMRLYCNNSIAELNKALYHYAAKCATWDFDAVVQNLDEQGNVAREASVRDFGVDYIGKLGWVSTKTADGYNQVAYSRAPENTGFNIIRLNVPEAGTAISADFVGMPNAAGYNSTKVDASTAGWTCGYVALKADGTRVYSDSKLVGPELKGNIDWTVPEGTEKLWMVVSCTPSVYKTHGWDEDDTNDPQWPYKVKFSGTDLFGTINFDGTETPHSIEITKNVEMKAADGYSGPAIVLDEDDLMEIGKAFVMQPYDIASKIAADRANVQSGEVKFAAVEPDGSLSYNYTANNYGFWFAGDGSVCGWGADATVFSEFSQASWTFQLGSYPGHVSAGETYTIRQALVYKDYTATIKFNMTIK